jgi:hypothetical protein
MNLNVIKLILDHAHRVVLPLDGVIFTLVMVRNTIVKVLGKEAEHRKIFAAVVDFNDPDVTV